MATSRCTSCLRAPPTGRLSTLSPIFGCNQFEFPWPAWAVASWSSGPQAGGNFILIATEPPCTCCTVGCCPFLFGCRKCAPFTSVADCFPEYRLLTRSRPPAPPAEPEPPFAARSAVHRARSVVLFCGVNFGCTSSIYKRIILPYNLTSGLHCTCIKCGM